jgi:uncharacterized protein (TIGR02246 family)
MKNLFILLFSLGISASSIGQTAQMVQDSQDIQTLLDNMAKAWNMHDAAAFSIGFSEDADFTNVVGMSAHGRDSIEKFHKKPFATWFKNSSLKITEKKIRYITGDITEVDVWWEMTGAQAPDGKNIPLRKGLINLVMMRSGDKWLILIMHNMDLPVS